MTDDIVQTFIFEGREYVLTGRVAMKKSERGRERELVEIRPVTVRDLEDKTYNKWVRRAELFNISEIGDE